MSKGKIAQKSEISKLLGAKPVLPGENAEEYAAGLAALVAELDAKTVLQIYLAEKIYDCLGWIRRYEAHKRMVMIAVMAEIVDRITILQKARSIQSSSVRRSSAKP